MPVQRVPPVYFSVDENRALIDALADELRRDSSVGASDAPFVREEATIVGTKRVTVIWDRWQGLDHESRGKVIMQAYLDAKGAQEALTITAALGLTRAEAAKLGVDASAVR